MAKSQPTNGTCEDMSTSRDPASTDELLDCACKQRFDEATFTPFLKENCHFWEATDKQIARLGLSFNNSKADEYSYLENLTPELFSSMVEVLLHFQQQPRAGTSHEENKAFILNYHFRWKTQKPFHLKIIPHSLEDFRSTILHYVPDALNMSNPSIYTEYEVYESKLKFIKENIHDGDAFHALDDTCDDGMATSLHDMLSSQGMPSSVSCETQHTPGKSSQLYTNDGLSSLMLASGNGHGEIVKKLLSAGAEVNHQDADGRSSLLLASENGLEEVVSMGNGRSY
ncbi:hypothetical protein EMCRGX_G000802 [Ephydatia muelleri]